jgi:hypothetical protein
MGWSDYLNNFAVGYIGDAFQEKSGTRLRGGSIFSRDGNRGIVSTILIHSILRKTEADAIHQSLNGFFGLVGR